MREAGGGGGLAVSVTPGQAMSYVQFTTEKDGAGPEFLPRLGPQDSKQGQSTSMEERPYKGPLNWLPDRCCRMEGLVLAASPSFLQTTCEEAHGVRWRAHPALPTGLTYLLPYHPAKSPTSAEPWSWERKLRPQEGGGAEIRPLPTVNIFA